MDLTVRSWRDLGVRIDNIRSSFLPYGLLTIILVTGLLLILDIFGVASTLVSWHRLYPSFLVLIFLSSLQELFFRGYLILVLRRFSKKVAIVVLIDAVLFAALHLLFQEQQIFVPGAFLAGVGFATVYYYYPNLILASLVHIVLDWSIIPFCNFKLLSC